MSFLFQYNLSRLEELENITLPSFSTELAWEMGSYARKLALENYPDRAVAVDISLATGQVLFHSYTQAGGSYDNEEWINKKKRVVFRMNRSSFWLGKKLRLKEASLEESYLISSQEFASHGGSVPIRIANFDSVVGALTISGLLQEQDHLLAIEVLDHFKA